MDSMYEYLNNNPTININPIPQTWAVVYIPVQAVSVTLRVEKLTLIDTTVVSKSQSTTRPLKTAKSSQQCIFT